MFKHITKVGLTPWLPKYPYVQLYICYPGRYGKIQHGLTANVCSTSGSDGTEKMDLKCKVALVTGGASGIGYAIANELLCEGLYRVVIADLDPCKGLKSADKLNDMHGGSKCCYFPLNVACAKQLEEVMMKVQDNFKNLDILINSTGIVSSDVDLEIDTNLRSVIYSTKTAFCVMKNQKNKGGVIINIGDIKGLAGCKHLPVYAAGKSGIHKYSMGIGRDSVEKSGVRVIALAPGPTSTELSAKLQAHPDTEGSQRAMIVGRAVTFTARYAESGTLWTVEQTKLFRARWPAKSSYLELITCL